MFRFRFAPSCVRHLPSGGPSVKPQDQRRNLSVHASLMGQDMAVVTLQGELDISTTALLEAVLLPMPGRGIRHLVVVTDRLRFCDMHGFGCWPPCTRSWSSTGGRLVIAEPTPALRRLMDLIESVLLTSSEPPIGLYATVSEALAAASGRSTASTPCRVNRLSPPATSRRRR